MVLLRRCPEAIKTALEVEVTPELARIISRELTSEKNKVYIRVTASELVKILTRIHYDTLEQLQKQLVELQSKLTLVSDLIKQALSTVNTDC